MTDDDLSITFAALADPIRRAILTRLSAGEATVNELAEPFPVSLQAVSRHLKVLERAGLISRGKDAQFRPCRLEEAPLGTAVEWIEQHRQMWEERMDRLEVHLRNIRRQNRSTTDAASKHTHTPTEESDMSKTQTVVDADKGEVTITRIYDAPRELVFRAMVEPEQLVEFWGPTGSHVPLESVVIEPWVGGRFESTIVMDDGSGAYPMKGTFTEFVEPEKMTTVEPESNVVSASTFTDLGDGRTEVVIHQTNVPELYRSPEALAGFVTSLDRFDAFLTARVAAAR